MRFELIEKSVSLTSFNLVGFGVVPNVWGLGFCYLHLTILLCLGQSKVLLVPLKTKRTESVNFVSPSTVLARCNGGSHRTRPLRDLDRWITKLTVGY